MDFINALFSSVEELPHLFADQAAWLTEQPWFLALVAILTGIILIDLVKLIRPPRKIVPGCGFCSSASGQPLTRVVRRWRWRGVVALETINPVVPGHIVVVSHCHTRDAGESPRVTALVMRCAAELVAELGAANIITSKGAAATQRFKHLHVHVVPREEGDGLAMPWTGQVIEEEATAS